MEDKKDLMPEGLGEEENKEIDKKATEKISGQSEYAESELNDELEKLAQTFREELKKTKEDIQDEEEEIIEDKYGPIPEEELCTCCGEARRDKSFGENYEFCADCRDAMTRYPFAWYSFIPIVFTVIIAFFSVTAFFGEFEGYYIAHQARQAEKESKLTSAIAYYKMAIDAFDESDINAKNLKMDCAYALYDTMPDGPTSMMEISELIEDSLSDFESNLPVYKSRVDLRNEVLVMYGTMQEFYNIVNSEEYENVIDESVYDQVFARIEGIIDMKISVESIDGEKSQDFPADEAVVRFCEYMYAYTAGHHEDSYKYMKMVQELKPDYLWLYAYEMGIVESQTGDINVAEEFADKLYSVNIETSGAYCIYSSVERLKGNYDKAVEWADKGLENCKVDTEIMRHKAMALAAKGDAKAAKDVMDEALTYEENGLLYMVLAVVENELGNKDRVKEIIDYIEENGVTVTDRVNDCLDGKITAEQIFTEGTGDIQ